MDIHLIATILKPINNIEILYNALKKEAKKSKSFINKKDVLRDIHNEEDHSVSSCLSTYSCSSASDSSSSSKASTTNFINVVENKEQIANSSSSSSSRSLASAIIDEFDMDQCGGDGRAQIASLINGYGIEDNDCSKHASQHSISDHLTNSTADTTTDSNPIIYFNNFKSFQSKSSPKSSGLKPGTITQDNNSSSSTVPAADIRGHKQSCSKQSRREKLQKANIQTYNQVQSILKRLLQEQQIACEAWNEVANEYHRRVEPFTSKFVPHLLDTARVDVKDKFVLDVASGTGAAALYAATKGAAYVTATDFSQRMLDVIERRIDDVPWDGDAAAGGGAGLDMDDNSTMGYDDFAFCKYPCHPSYVVETVLADGLCLPSKWANQYDVVCSNFGVIYFPKVGQGLSEMVKCAKPGGKVCITGWGNHEETQAFGIFPMAMRVCGFDNKWVGAQSESRKDILALAGITPDEDEILSRRQKQKFGMTPNYFCPTKRISSSLSILHSLLTDSGLGNVQVVGPITHDLKLDNSEDYWSRFVLASPNLKRVVEQCLTADEAVQLRDVVFQLLREKSCTSPGVEGEFGMDREGVILQSSAYVAFGTKI